MHFISIFKQSVYRLFSEFSMRILKSPVNNDRFISPFVVIMYILRTLS